MAVGSYGLRAGGLWVVQSVELPPFARRALSHSAGAVFVALLTPAVLDGGWPDLAATAVAAAVALATRRLWAVVVAGTLAAALFRSLP